MTDMLSLSDLAIPGIIAGLIGGVAGAIVSLIPIFNLCCCGVMALTGFLAAFLVKRMSNTVDPKNGALAGAISGVFYGLISGIAQGALTALRSVLELSMAGASGMSNQLAAMFGVGGGLILVVLSFFVGLIIFGILGVLFGAVGGAIGGSIFEK